MTKKSHKFRGLCNARTEQEIDKPEKAKGNQKMTLAPLQTECCAFCIHRKVQFIQFWFCPTLCKQIHLMFFLFYFISHRKSTFSSRHIFSSLFLVVQIEINVGTMYSINCMGFFHYIWNRNLNTITMSHPFNRQSLYGIELGRKAIQFFVMKNSEVIWIERAIEQKQTITIFSEIKFE